jgi:hypothetical protein
MDEITEEEYDVLFALTKDESKELQKKISRKLDKEVRKTNKKQRKKLLFQSNIYSDIIPRCLYKYKHDIHLLTMIVI